MQKRDLIQANASLENLRQNLDMKDIAKEILLEENYNKFIRSYKFTFWFQLIGVLAGFIVPSVVLLIIFKEFIYCAFGATIGIFWMCVWMMLSMVIPPTIPGVTDDMLSAMNSMGIIRRRECAKKRCIHMRLG